jgi:hypothetical protein
VPCLHCDARLPSGGQFSHSSAAPRAPSSATTGRSPIAAAPHTRPVLRVRRRQGRRGAPRLRPPRPVHGLRHTPVEHRPEVSAVQGRGQWGDVHHVSGYLR